jgi:hypothetical protein
MAVALRRQRFVIAKEARKADAHVSYQTVLA